MRLKSLNSLAERTGLEPATSGVTGRILSITSDYLHFTNPFTVKDFKRFAIMLTSPF